MLFINLMFRIKYKFLYVHFVFILLVVVVKKTKAVRREKQEKNLQVILYPNSPTKDPPIKIPTAFPTPKYPELKSP